MRLVPPRPFVGRTVKIECLCVCGRVLRATGLSWLLLYRTEGYNRRKDAIERLQKKGARSHPRRHVAANIFVMFDSVWASA